MIDLIRYRQEMRTFYRMETIEINFLSHPTPEHLARLTMLTAMLEKKMHF